MNDWKVSGRVVVIYGNWEGVMINRLWHSKRLSQLHSNVPSYGFSGFCVRLGFYQFSVKTENFYCLDCQMVKMPLFKGCECFP